MGAKGTPSRTTVYVVGAPPAAITKCRLAEVSVRDARNSSSSDGGSTLPLKLAATFRLSDSSSWQVPVPVQASPQPWNCAPECGEAVRVAGAFSGSSTLHTPG